MLQLIKRYQKIFILITAFFVCISVVFLGLMPRNLSRQVDPVVFKTQVGRRVKKSEFEGMKALLKTSWGELLLYGQHLGMHFYPQDIFRDLFVKTEILELLAQKNEERVQQELSKILDQEKRFKPYSHPQAPFLSANQVWSEHAPELKKDLERYQSNKDVKNIIKLKTKLFLDESEFSPFALWQFISERQSNYSWIANDENLRPLSLALFGHRTIQDWFGDTLINQVCQLIFEMSSEAKKRGYSPSFKEAEKELKAMNQQNFEQLRFIGFKDITDADTYLEEKLDRLAMGFGVNSVKAINLFRDVLAIKQYINEASKAPLIDPQTLEGFESYAHESVSITKYSLPSELQLNSLNELAQLEAYLEALGKKQKEVSLNFDFKPISLLKKESPELLEQEIALRYKEVDLSKEALGISVQKVWSWKCDPKNALTLKTKFPKLKIDGSQSKEEYTKEIEELDAFSAMQVDRFARSVMLKENPTWLKRALEAADEKQEVINARLSGQNLPFKSLDTFNERDKFLSEFFSYLDFKEAFSFDDRYFYQLLEVEEKKPANLVSYATLKQERTLEMLLEQRLKNFHEKNNFEEPDFKKARREVLAKWLEPIKSSIRKEVLKSQKQLPKVFGDDFYCSNRFLFDLELAKNYYAHASEHASDSFQINELWSINASNETLSRQNNPYEFEEWLAMNIGDFSKIFAEKKQPYFGVLRQKGEIDINHQMYKEIKAQMQKEVVKGLVEKKLKHIHFQN